MIALEQHQQEIHENLKAWERKPLLQAIYEGFYERIRSQIDDTVPGLIVEIGSGIGNLKRYQPRAICTDLFANPWLDLVCDGYELPFPSGSVSHLVLFDVFHHLRAPMAFLKEARRALTANGRVILFEPYISLASYPVYGGLHHEPVGWREKISNEKELARPRDYYAAQGNATRVFFGEGLPEWKSEWRCLHAEAFSAFNYLLSGGYSKPALYPARLVKGLSRLDEALSRWPKVFGARCLVTLSPGTK
jgi:SAM-dependent methyltransferase